MTARSSPAWIRFTLTLSAVLGCVSLAGVGWILAESSRLEGEMELLARSRSKMTAPAPPN